MNPLLEIRDLTTIFLTKEGTIHAVEGLSFDVLPGEVFALVGESGSGKTVTAFSILQLIEPPGQIQSGRVILEGRSLLELSEKEMSRVRGREIAMVFQDPQSRLNPVFSIGAQLGELYQVHWEESSQQAREHAAQQLELVGIPDPEQNLSAYPHELSGGQAQRVMIAMALALEPKLIIADEPTSALDVTIQAQILELVREIASEHGTSFIWITHDLGVVAGLANRIGVMYAGRLLELGEAGQLFSDPLHPYTQGLLEALPAENLIGRPLRSLPVEGPEPNTIRKGCRFAPRCEARKEYGLEICEREEPVLESSVDGHTVRCWLYQAGPDHDPPLAIS